MFNLRSVAIKLLRAASVQVLTSIGIIAISICLLMTMGVYIWNANTQMKEEMQAIFGDADMLVGYNPEQNQWITDGMLDQFEQLDEVSAVSPIVLAWTSVEGQADVYTIGADNDNLVKSRYHFTEDLKNGEVVISKRLAAMHDKAIGDTIIIEQHPFKIKEIMTPLSGGDELNIVILPRQQVKQWLPEGGQEIAALFTLIQTNDNIEYAALTKSFHEIGSTLRIDIPSEYEIVKKNFQALAIFIIVLSAFVLLITAMLLLSTFQLIFYKLRDQLMVLRSLGATGSQVGKVIKFQLLIMIGSGIVTGTALTVLLIHEWMPFLIDKLQLPAARTDMPIWLMMGILIGIFAVLYGISAGQIRKSMKLLPLQIAAEKVELSIQWTKRKLLVIGFLFVCACLFILIGLASNGDGKSALQILVGALGICFVVLYCIPFLFSVLLKVSLQPIRAFFGKEAYLACQQLMPQIRRNMPVVLGIIGLMVILVFGSTLFKTVQKNEREYLGHVFETPVIIENDLYDESLTLDTVKEIKSLPSVKDAYAKSNYFPMRTIINDSGEEAFPDFQLVDLQEIEKKERLPVQVNIDAAHGIFVTEDFALRNQLSVGETLDVYEYGEETDVYRLLDTVEVLAILPDTYSGEQVYADWSMASKVDWPIVIETIMVETQDVDTALDELSFLKSSWPALLIKDERSSVEESNRMFYQRWSLFVGVLIILIAATCLGVIQSLLHVIYSKRGDYAIQRLVGLSPNGLMKLILTQVLSFVLYGLTVGVIIGALLSQLLSLIDSESSLLFDVQMLLYVIIGFILAVMVTFLIQGYLISRRHLAGELVE